MAFATVVLGFAGDDVELRVTVDGVSPADLLASMTLTVKPAFSTPDAQAALTKTITPTDQPGIGQIENTGASGTGEARFDLLAAETAALGAKVYWYDVRTQTVAGKVYTLEVARLVLKLPVRQVV